MDRHEFHSQRQARLHLNQDQDFPPIHIILFRHRLFLPFDLHFSRLFDLAAPRIASQGRHFTAIQSHQQGSGKPSPTGQQLHHGIEEPFHLFLRDFTDVVRQALGRERSLFLFRGATALSAFGQPVFTLVGVEADQLHQGQIAKEHAGQFIHRLTAQQHFEEIEQHKLHRGDQRSLHSRQIHLFKRFQHPQVFEKHKKFIQQPCIAEMMHLIYGLSGIQCLCDFPLISPGNLPIEAFLHHTCFFSGLFALHAFLPFARSVFLQLTTFPLPHSLFHQLSYCW